MSDTLMVIAAVIVGFTVWQYCKALRAVLKNKYHHAKSPSIQKSYFLCRRPYIDLIRTFKKKDGAKKKRFPGWGFFWPVFLVLGAIHIVIILTCSIVMFAVCWVLWAIDAGYRRFNSTLTVCPHPGCYAKNKLPAYKCVGKEVHDKLYPSSNGILWRTCNKCEKCEEKIPTTFLSGRNNLSPCCPKCKKPFDRLKKSWPIEVPIVGAPSAGKTYFLHLMIRYIKNKFDKNNCDFVKHDEEQSVDSYIEKINAGEAPVETTKNDPTPLRFYLTMDGNPLLIHLYDPNGNVFSGSKYLERHKFYNHFDGLVFVIDPFSIPEVRFKYEGRSVEAGVRPELTAYDVFESLIMTFEKNCNIKVTDRINNPTAIVFSKTGALDLPTDEACRQFLRDNGEESLLNKIDWKFANVRYFAIDSGGENSAGISDTVNWLLGKINKKNARTKLMSTIGVATGALIAACAIAASVFFAVRVTAPSVRSGIAWTHRVSTETRWYTSNINATSYTISTADELAGLARIVNGNWRLVSGGPKRDNFYGKTIKLAEDIDLSAYENWVPIGNHAANTDNVFSGMFDGGGHVIRGLKIDRPDIDFQGLFGNISGGRVENLGLDNVDIRGRDRVGGVAAIIKGSRIVKCHTTGKINAKAMVGGLVGVVSGNSNVSGSYSDATVIGNNNVGGVAGQIISNCNIVNCYSTDTVRGNRGRIGGIVGTIRDNSGLTDSYSAATVSGDSEVGGVAGTVIANSHISGSYAVGLVSGGKEVGGVAGSIRVDCRVSGSAALNPVVKGTGADVGRVIGLSFKKNILSNNAALTEMKNASDNTAWNKKGPINASGADISAATIRRDGTIGGRFTAANGWTVQNGALPGITESMIMPPHLADDIR